MAQSKSDAERARRYRSRKRCGTVIIQDLELKRSGVEILINRGWLDAERANDPAQIRAALVNMINDALSGRHEGFRSQLGRHVQALKTIAFGIF
ncbi:MAG: hypothetical protein WBX25_06090 [Rhodomicrobium sp.]